MSIVLTQFVILSAEDGLFFIMSADGFPTLKYGRGSVSAQNEKQAILCAQNRKLR